MARQKGVEITYLIDPDTRTFAKRLKQIGDKAAKPQTVQDVRKALDDKNLDAISIATPNHWHALMTIWACQAGKDVYVEKPCSHNVHEGRIAVEAARKYNRIVQHGTQSRSEPGMAEHGRDRQIRPATASCWSPAACATSRGIGRSTRGDIGFEPTKAPPQRTRFQPLAGAGAEAAVPRQPGPLQLALVLGLRQRRHRQPGRPPDGHRPLDDPGRDAAQDGLSLGGRFGYKDQGRRPTRNSPSSTSAARS